jgi:hypothetical protein
MHVCTVCKVCMYVCMYVSSWLPVKGWVAVRSGLIIPAKDSDETETKSNIICVVCMYVCIYIYMYKSIYCMYVCTVCMILAFLPLALSSIAFSCPICL